MIDVLNRIPEEYVFLTLDDFFCCAPLNTDYFDEIVSMMESDKSIASVQMNGTRIRNANPQDYIAAEEMTVEEIWEKGWRTHFVPTIRRKFVLLK